MSLFSSGGKKDDTAPCRSAGNAGCAESRGASVKVLGGGCAKCRQLESAAKAALARLGMDATVGHVINFTEIAAYGVMSTPALVINDKVVSCGKVLKTDEIVGILQKMC